MLEPIEHRTVADAVLGRLLGLLKSGTLGAGDQLPTEQQIMEELGVSRPPVREALNALAGMGLVEKRQGSGHYVRTVRLGHILGSEATAFLDMSGHVADIVESRMFLEVEIIAKVVRETEDEQLELLRECLARMRDALQAGEYSPQHSTEFHVLLAQLTGNSVLPQLVEFLNRLGLRTEEAMLLPSFDPEFDLRLHEQILEVIEKRNEQMARQVMREHITTTLERAQAAERQLPAGELSGV